MRIVLIVICISHITSTRKCLARVEWQGHLKSSPLLAAKVPAVLKKGGPTRRAIAAEPCFIVGDVVMTKSLSQISPQQNNHTRLPYYASVKKGVIIAGHDAHILPDSHAHFKGEAPEYLYGVRFLAGDLFPDP